MRLTEYAQSICGCGCGLPYAVSHDPDQPFIVDSTVCYAQRQLAKVREDENEQHKDRDPKWSVGRHHFVYAPTEQELAERLKAAEQAREEAAE